MSEATEQIRLFTWAANWEDEIPELRLLFHPPNGGWRHKATAGRLKAMGTKPGVPDVWLPVARCGYHGLVIEMKYGRNKPTDSQLWWIDGLMEQGWRVEVCYSCEEAKGVILEYLKGTSND